MTVPRVLLVLAGGGLGSACRYLLATLAARCGDTGFPAGTLGVNLIGSFLIGIGFSLVGRDLLSPSMRLVFMTGFLGGLTTFSTYALETVALLRGRELMLGMLNVAANNLGGLVLVLVGFWVGGQIWKV